MSDETTVAHWQDMKVRAENAITELWAVFDSGPLLFKTKERWKKNMIDGYKNLAEIQRGIEWVEFQADIEHADNS